jgi:hypothetical protein
LTLPVAGDAEDIEDTDSVEGSDSLESRVETATASAVVAAEVSAPVVEPAPSDDEPVYVVDRTEA